MKPELHIYNSLTRTKEKFEPLQAPHVGLYVCGPTVYGHAHLGHARSAITFDVVYRYLTFLGYKVRYVRNITDVGHLTGDADDGEDKIGKKAKAEQLEPMQVAQSYTNSYREDMAKLNILPPSIEPLATGHIPEQIALVERIVEAGFAYEVDGSVYFDVPKYNSEKNKYGILSGQDIEELQHQSRTLEGGSDKRSPLDFALWKKAEPSHLMQWDSPWGRGFPGWHLECTAMSTKYLGAYYDIHGGGMDLRFPHHECEIAQAQASHSSSEAKYWMHNNMITIEGQKMGKSLGNFILMQEFFSGEHEKLSQAFTPMTIRYFMLQAQYGSTLDFSNEALQAAAKGYAKINNGLRIARSLKYTEPAEKQDEKLEEQIDKDFQNFRMAMNDDFNTAKAVGFLFNALKKINSFHTQPERIGTISEEKFKFLLETFIQYTEDILGLKAEDHLDSQALIADLLSVYAKAKRERDYDQVDAIRAMLKEQGVAVKDLKHGVDWGYVEN